jgi:hypothetical protein
LNIFRQSPEGSDLAGDRVHVSGAAIQDDTQHQFGDVSNRDVIALFFALIDALALTLI